MNDDAADGLRREKAEEELHEEGDGGGCCLDDASNEGRRAVVTCRGSFEEEGEGFGSEER